MKQVSVCTKARGRRNQENGHMRRTFNKSLSIIALGCSALLYSVTGCSRAPEAPPKTVAVEADDKMRFDVTAFEVKPGQKVSITLKNIGTTPKFSMGHNLVLLDKTVNTGNVTKFLDAAAMAASSDYVPKGSKEVLAATKLLGPNETDTITFTAPHVPGEYLYLCSFPGHYSQGTKGFMTVK
jgi:azurin